MTIVIKHYYIVIWFVLVNGQGRAIARRLEDQRMNPLRNHQKEAPGTL